MSIKQYYFVASALPSLSFGVKPEISFYELCELLKQNLLPSDEKKIEAMRRYFDIQNIRALILGQPLTPYANDHSRELAEAVLTRTGLPPYILDFLNEHEPDEERLHFFSHLYASYFNQEIAGASGFLRKYLTFERRFRLVIAFMRARSLNKNIESVFELEDPSDPFVSELLLQKEAMHFQPPEGYEELKVIFDQYKQDPLALHKALSIYCFDKVEEMVGMDSFSIDRILGYFAQFLIIDRWLLLDKDQGMAIIQKLNIGISA